jgi:hypothetical protein
MFRYLELQPSRFAGILGGVFLSVAGCHQATPFPNLTKFCPSPNSLLAGRLGQPTKTPRRTFLKRSRHPEVHPTLSFVLLDDIGYGQASVFGGPVPTPHI